MALSRSARLGVVLQLAQRAENASVEALQNSRRALAQSREQLQQIEDYKREYLTEVNSRSGRLNVRTMINDRQFLQQLQRVMQTQREQIQQLSQAEARCLRNWQLSYQKRRGIERLIEQLRFDESAVAEKRLQKEMDELSSQTRQYHTDWQS